MEGRAIIFYDTVLIDQVVLINANIAMATIHSNGCPWWTLYII